VAYYFDLAQTASVLVRILVTPRSRSIALGFFVNKSERPLRHAVCPEAKFVRVNFPRAKRGWDAARFTSLLKRLAAMTSDRPVTAIVWGYRDRKNHGVDVGRYFDRCVRVERGLVDPPRARRSAFVVGERSIYFDGREETDLERRLNKLEPGLLPHSPNGKRLLDYILASALTKYPSTSEATTRPTARDLLIVGQCSGDQAILETHALARDNPGLMDLVARHLLADGHGFERVYYKPHPRNGTNSADLTYFNARYPHIAVIEDGVSIVPLLAAKPTVATLTSGVGIEAAVRGCTVHTFGVPFYSHWGFTIDHLPCPRRTNRLSPEDVFLSVVMEHTRYADPSAGRPIGASEAFGLSRVP
jgi:capsular polysaccharide export protein